ncbi:MAG: HAMP domain-containing protein, partial [Planctomycetota bacterium]|nr:HAMP domain-containing protein [Planctomycetota bacterium]
MKRSLITLTLLFVGGVVLLLGAAVVGWITTEDERTALRQAADEQDQAERSLAELAAELLELSQEVTGELSNRHTERLRAWLEEEPFDLYRRADDPSRVDVEAIMDTLVVEGRAWGREEKARIAVLRERMEAWSQARVETAMTAQRTEAARRAEQAASDRASSLSVRLGLLLLGMAVLLAVALVVFVVRPVQRLRRAVDRIAEGDLATPVPLQKGGAEELRALAHDVERMRDQIRTATEGLEDEVRRKTAELESTLDERTKALDELKATRDRLVQAAKMAGLGTLAGGVAHEFNNLLGGILGCLESARAESHDDSVVEDLDVAHKTASRAAVLVQALLDVARPGQRSFAPVELGEVVADVLRAADPTASRRGIEIAREVGDEVRVEGDEGQLHQVVLNLVTNALQAVDDGEAVTVATRAEDGRGIVEVRDAGTGV